MKALQAFALLSLMMLCNFAVADNHASTEPGPATDSSAEAPPADDSTSTPDEEYKKVFKINFAKSCLDGDESEMAREICDCMSDELTRTKSVSELIDITDYDEKVVMLRCLER